MGQRILYHVHSEYSLLDSCTKFKDYVDLEVEAGSPAIASTEHGKPMGWVSKKMYCDSKGIKFIHGVEIYLTEQLEPKVRDNYHTVLLAKNLAGVYELNRLVSISCDPEHTYYTNRISFDEFMNISDNIIKISACLASPLNKLLDEHPRYMELANKYDFLEIQPHNCEDQINFNKRLYRLATQINKPLIAGTDTHSSSQYKAECRAVLLSAKSKNYGDEDSFDLTYKTYDELVEMFRRQNALPKEVYLQAIDNTMLLNTITDNFELDKAIKYPILYGSREADSQKFIETIENKFNDKVARGIIPEYQIPAFKDAIKEELRVFQKLNMDGFMLSMSELISWCKEQKMAIGTARGSVGGSRIAYITDIIDLNPETWNTVFSRFCNEDRLEIGDIDIDCIESDRPQIFNYITQRFGADHTGRVASFGTLQDKAVIDEIGRHFSNTWARSKGINPKDASKYSDNPWHLKKIAKIKDLYSVDADTTRKKYPEFFYYFDGLLDTKISQSVHPAGMVISPVSLTDYYGMFCKDGENCLMMDMEEAHEVGAAKYDFLVLKTVQVIRDTCRYIGIDYPKTNEIDWNDKEVWESMNKDLTTIFQFESVFAADSFKKFKPQNIFDMSLVTACIRPSGSSYRDALLSRKPHSNPSEIIDELLKDNLGYLIYQEDTIKFLQQICGLSGSEADNIRRAIGRKQKDRLDKAMPSILEGYCNKSPKTREEAESEAKEFLQIIEDSASYQFGYNHSIAYCLLGYLCGYYRYHYPLQYLTAFLNNAANDNDIINGTSYAQRVGIEITVPKWGISRGDYAFDTEKNVIAKGMASIKYMSPTISEELFNLAHIQEYTNFTDVLYMLTSASSIDSRQLEILIKLDFFSEFGNQRELLRIMGLFYDTFKKGELKQIKKEQVDGTAIGEIIKRYSNGKTKAGDEAKSYTILDLKSILRETEEAIKAIGMEDLPILSKVQYFKDAMGYIGYVSNKPEDRRKLYVLDVFPLRRKSDNTQFGYSIRTKSIGSGVESRFTVRNSVFNKDPILKDSIIYCRDFLREGAYFRLISYEKIT